MYTYVYIYIYIFSFIASDKYVCYICDAWARGEASVKIRASLSRARCMLILIVKETISINTIIIYNYYFIISNITLILSLPSPNTPARRLLAEDAHLGVLRAGLRKAAGGGYVCMYIYIYIYVYIYIY